MARPRPRRSSCYMHRPRAVHRSLVPCLSTKGRCHGEYNAYSSRPLSHFDVQDRTIDTSARTVATAHIYGGYARRLDFKEHRAEPETRRATYYLLQRSSDYLPLRPREWFPNLFEADLIISSRYGTAAFLALPHHLTSLKVTFGRDLSLAGLATIEQFAQLQELVVTTMERAPLTLAPFLKMARTLRVLRIRHVYPVVFDKTTLEKLLRRFRALRTLEITPRAPECPVGGVSAVALDCLAAVHDTQHVALEEFAAYFCPDRVPQPVRAYACRTAEVTLLDLGMDISAGVAGGNDIARYARSLFPEARLEGGYPVSAFP